MKLTKTRRKLYVQAVEYMVSGGVYFWVGYLLLDGFYYGLKWNLWWSTIVSSILGWFVNYLLQRYWVFASDDVKGSQTKVTGRYAFITILDFLLNYLILFGFKQIGITPAIGQFGSAAFFTFWNYTWYRFWVFPDKKDQERVKQTIMHIFAHRSHSHGAYWKA